MINSKEEAQARLKAFTDDLKLLAEKHGIESVKTGGDECEYNTFIIDGVEFGTKNYSESALDFNEEINTNLEYREKITYEQAKELCDIDSIMLTNGICFYDNHRLIYGDVWIDSSKMVSAVIKIPCNESCDVNLKDSRFEFTYKKIIRC